MRITSLCLCGARPVGSVDLRLCRVPRSILALLGLAAVIVGGQQINMEMQSPGKTIRAALAAADMRAPETAQPSRDMLQAVSCHVRGNLITRAIQW